MLSWSEVRRMIVASIRDDFARLGFNNPGVTTWRFRPDFIDVIEFRSPRQGIFAVEFGCELREGSRQNPKPHHCEFRVQPSHAFGWHQKVSFWFQHSPEEQRRQLDLVVYHLRPAIESWFDHFATIDTALTSLHNNAFQTQHEVAMCNPGSIAFRELEQRIAKARHNRAVNQSGGSGGF